jgi:hypothetical protein
MENQPSTMQTLKQILKMGACCAGPILGLALLAPLAGTLGIGLSSILSTLLVLACPLSMLVMMYFIMRGQKAERQGQGQAEGQPRPQLLPAQTAVAMVEGNGQPKGHEAVPIPEEIQLSAVNGHATVKRQHHGP